MLHLGVDCLSLDFTYGKVGVLNAQWGDYTFLHVLQGVCLILFLVDRITEVSLRVTKPEGVRVPLP